MRRAGVMGAAWAASQSASFPSPGLAAKIVAWYRYSAADAWANTDGTGAITADGDLVRRWSPVSGYGSYPLLQSTDDTYRPAHNVNSGYETLEFDNSADYMLTATTETSLALPLNIFAVASRSSTSGSAVVPLVTLTVSNTNYVRLGYRPDLGYLYGTSRLASGSVSLSSASGSTNNIPINTQHSMLARFEQGTTTVRANGTDVGSNSNGWTTETGSAFIIRLASETNTPGAAMGKDYRDVIILSGTLTSDEIEELDLYGESRKPA